MVRFEQGQIVVLDIADPDGKPATHNHPAVIVSPTDRIEASDIVRVVGISTKYTDPPPAHWIKIPWQRDGRARTGLDKPCVAKCDWLVKVKKSQLVRPIGAVPTSVLKVIIEQVSTLLALKKSGK
jgi:mRNA-degrading endonuclease toxin of MazEF toxin-antitoxin module